MLNDIKRIALRLDAYNLNPECQKMTEKVHCSVCDGDMGIAKKKGLCPNVCKAWHDSCQGETVENDEFKLGGTLVRLLDSD